MGQVVIASASEAIQGGLQKTLDGFAELVIGPGHIGLARNDE
jgi:hypothetical protein